MTLYIGPGQSFSKWTEQKGDLLELMKARDPKDHKDYRLGVGWLARKNPKMFNEYSRQDGDWTVYNSPEKVARHLEECVNKYNIHIRWLGGEWDLIFKLLDQIIEKYWDLLDAMVVDRRTKSITFMCIGSDLATDLGKTVVALFGSYARSQYYFPDETNKDGMIHVQGPVYYSGGQILHRTSGFFPIINGPKYRLFDEIHTHVSLSHIGKAAPFIEILERFWDRSTNYGLYNGQAKLNILEDVEDED